MMAGEILNQSGHAHSPATKTTDYLVQFISHLTANEHRFAVDNLGDMQVGVAVLVQREPALLAADASGNDSLRRNVVQFCNCFLMLVCNSR